MKNVIIFFVLLFAVKNLYSQQAFQFQTTDARDAGIGFYSLDKKTGQLFFMWDTGTNAGKWQKYGKTIDSTGKGSYEFQVAYRGSDGSGFYAMDNRNGQVYYMWDTGAQAGTWSKYGGLIDATAKSDLLFSITDRGEGGIGFYGQDNKTAQVYYMWDSGTNAGKWTKYGTTIAK